MAPTPTRDEITAWVNPEVWDDPDHAERVIDAILQSGSDREADWVRIAGGDHTDTLAAATRDFTRTATAHEQATEELKAAVRAATAAGMSESAVASTTRLSRNTVRTWIGKGTAHESTRSTSHGSPCATASTAPATHRYEGDCPDDLNPDSRDPECPACSQLCGSRT